MWPEISAAVIFSVALFSAAVSEGAAGAAGAGAGAAGAAAAGAVGATGAVAQPRIAAHAASEALCTGVEDEWRRFMSASNARRHKCHHGSSRADLTPQPHGR